MRNPVFQEAAEVCGLLQLTSDIYRLTLHAPGVAGAARSGQFVMLKVAEGLDPLLRRPFSVHLAGDQGSLEILFKVVGKGTRLLAAVQPGSRLDLVGPLGRGFSLPDSGTLCLVGGGIGAAPLLFLARENLRLAKPMPMHVVAGARNSSELAAVADGFADLGISVMTATDDGSSGHHGFAIDLLGPLAAAHGSDPIHVFSCGPHPMLRGIARFCRAHHWPCQVSLETMMACGVEACLGCAVLPAGGLEQGNYLHVCKDGPVFDAGEILWV